uniref:complement factor H-like isoform X1 n=1 Tax=Scatophagus argus TaxID=75038 RepID=UPI001ED810ED|nr:complement factor H-like isoform X1 [Scatophagus argus]
MCARYLGFVLLVWFPGVLHAQSAAQWCRAPRLKDGYFVPERETYDHNHSLTYACDHGRKPAVEGWWATSTCQNGKWHHIPQCIEEEACIPPEIPNGRYTESSNGRYEQGHKIRITCDKGYETKDRDATAICMSGMWSSVPVCEQSVSACSEPPKIPHAVIIHQEYQELFAEDSTVQYECEHGYTAKEEDKKTIYCIAGNWSEGPTCKKEGCIPPEIPNGRYTESSSGWYEEGHRIGITCDKGYETKDRDATAICMSGMWSSVPVCERSISACSEPPKIPDAVVIHQEYQELFAEDSTVQYECKDGYTATEEDKKTIYCISGNWSEGPTCRSSGSSGSIGRDTDPQITTISRCGTPPIVLNSIVETYPMYLKYKCGVFYTRVGPEKVVCYNDGTWSQVPTCKDAFCSVNTEEYPALKPDGVKFVRDGETVRLECVRQDHWWTDHYSVGRCTNGRMTLSHCRSWLQLKFC